MALPMQNAQADQMAKLLAGGGGGGGPQPGPGLSPTGQALQGASSQLNNANPNAVKQSIQQMSSDLAQVYLLSATNFPDATKDIDNARQALGRVMKVLDKMSQAQSAIAPIVNNAGIGPMPGGAPQGGPDLSALMQALG